MQKNERIQFEIKKRKKKTQINGTIVDSAREINSLKKANKVTKAHTQAHRKTPKQKNLKKINCISTNRNEYPRDT